MSSFGFPQFTSIFTTYIMERALRPDRLDISPDSATSEKEFKYWHKTLENYLDALPQENLDKLKILINYLSPTIFEYISEENTYQTAVEALKKVFIKPTNVVFARHLLSVRQQQPGETLDQYMQTLKTLSKDCGFEAVDASTHRDQYIRDTFIAGIRSSGIRQRLLEDKKVVLSEIFEQARALEHAQKNVESYNSTNISDPCVNAVVPVVEGVHLNSVTKSKQRGNRNNNYSNNNNNNNNSNSNSNNNSTNNNSNNNSNNNINANLRNNNNRANNRNSNSNRDPSHCWNCGGERHPRSVCDARDAYCYVCGTKGHFGQLCRKAQFFNNNPTSASVALAATDNPSSASVHISQFP